ncbi:MAG: ABC-F family ATP-binding cassette domain-containing protein [bacterium]
MLQVKDIVYAHSERQILNGVSFSLMRGEKAALVGLNGAGKTTLLKIIAGELACEEGEIRCPDRVGYVPQTITGEIMVRSGCSVEEFMMQGRGLAETVRRMHETLQILGSGSRDSKADQALVDYGEAEEKFQKSGGYEAASEIGLILNGIGLDLGLGRVVSTLSGGEKTRLAFARSLFSDCELMLLDEPTNHVDRGSYDWLGRYLKNTKQTVLVVSHHAEFVNPFTDRILEIEKATGKLREYRGNYESYVEQSRVNEITLARQAEWLDKEITRLTETAKRLRSAGPKKGRAAQSMLKRIERLTNRRGEIDEEILSTEKTLRIKFRVGKRPSQVLVRARQLEKKYAHIKELNFEIHRGDRTVVLGPNGSGKTTLMRMLMGQIDPDAGTLEFGDSVEMGYYSQEHEAFNDSISLLEELTRSNRGYQGNLRNILARFLFSRDGVFQLVGSLSPGEKSRLALCKLIIGGFNLIILDEPTNYLDHVSKQAVAEALSDYEGTSILVSHDSEFVKSFGPNKAIMMPSGKVSLFHDRLLPGWGFLLALYYWETCSFPQGDCISKSDSLRFTPRLFFVFNPDAREVTRENPLQDFQVQSL